jgi:hypothetical protein
MADSSDLWYRLGYALETTRHGGPIQRLRGLSDRAPTSKGRRDKVAPSQGTEPEGGDSSFELALAAGAGTALVRLLDLWPGRGRPGPLGLLRSAAAGALAATLRQALAPLLGGEVRAPEWDGEVGERLVAGAARGLLYGGLLEPRLPGPPLLRGLTVGGAEWALGEWGGLRGVLARHTPYRRLPVVGGVLGDAEAGERSLLDHLAFGVALALLYDAGSKMGMGDDAE